MHPLFENIDHLSDNEVEDKIIQLRKKYWQTQNLEIQQQITMLLDSYNLELEQRRAKQKLSQQSQENGDNNLDNLIKVS